MTDKELADFLARGGKITSCRAGAKTSFKNQIKNWSISKLVDKLDELDSYLSEFSDEDESPQIDKKSKERVAVIDTLLDKGWQKPKVAKTSGQAWFVSDVDGDGYRD